MSSGPYASQIGGSRPFSSAHVDVDDVIVALLAISVFAETLAVGGVGVARIVAPLAALAALSGWVRHGLGRLPWSAAPVAAYAIWALGSGLWTVSMGETVDRLWSLAIALAYAAAVVLLVRRRRHLMALAWGFTAGGAVTAMLAIVAYLGNPESRSGAGVGDPNFAAAFMLVSLPFALALAAETGGAARIVSWSTALLLVVGVLSTLSRGGLLGLALVIFLVLAAPHRIFFRAGSGRVVAGVVTLAVVGALLSGAGGPTRFATIFGDAGTGSGRVNEWRAATAAGRAEPFTGIGFGAFDHVSNELMRRTPGVDFRDFELRPEGSEVHSVYLGSLAELGVPGLVLIVALLATPIAACIGVARRARRTGDIALERVAWSAGIAAAGWCVTAAFLSSETSRPFWIVVGVGLALWQLAHARSPSPHH